MGQKLLITPVITPGGVPDEIDLRENHLDAQIRVPSAESTMRSVQLKNGAPEHFHAACSRLLKSFSGKTDTILVGGTTGEGIGF
ncbi:hypothetical protein H6768_05140 [Candidatus Peribacteria bacterium]|nr:hypothetical protein [Candidatus Peribacteria bacterium]